MFAKICDWFGGIVSGLRSRVSSLVALATVFGGCLLSGTAFGNSTPGTPMAIPMEAPNIDWMSLPSTLIGVLTTPVVVGIGVALSIWVILRAMAFFKRAA